MIFWDAGSSGFRRYSFISIFECSIHIFQASCETFSYTRLPSSPFQGTRSRPGMSLSNFTQWTVRAPGLAGILEAAGFVGPQSSAICTLRQIECLTFFLTTILQDEGKTKRA